jgi:hypothetical protein
MNCCWTPQSHSELLSRTAWPFLAFCMLRLCRKSFAIIEVDSILEEAFVEAHKCMLIFFELSGQEEKASLRRTTQERTGGTALLGFNSPSAAKELFRYRHEHSRQPTMSASERYEPLPCRGSVPSLVEDLRYRGCLSFGPIEKIL